MMSSATSQASTPLPPHPPLLPPSLSPSPPPPQVHRTSLPALPCKFFARGYCVHGSSCKYLHAAPHRPWDSYNYGPSPSYHSPTGYPPSDYQRGWNTKDRDSRDDTLHHRRYSSDDLSDSRRYSKSEEREKSYERYDYGYRRDWREGGISARSSTSIDRSYERGRESWRSRSRSRSRDRDSKWVRRSDGERSRSGSRSRSRSRDSGAKSDGKRSRSRSRDRNREGTRPSDGECGSDQNKLYNDQRHTEKKREEDEYSKKVGNIKATNTPRGMCKRVVWVGHNKLLA